MLRKLWSWLGKIEEFQHLSRLDDRLLKDIGLDRHELLDRLVGPRPESASAKSYTCRADGEHSGLSESDP